MTFTASFDALKNLHSVVDTALSIPVYRGQGLSADDGGDFVCVGFGADEDFTAIESSSDWVVMRAGNPPREESFDLVNLLVCQGGDTDLGALADRAKGYLEQIETGLGTDRTLGGAVRLARVSSFRMLNQQATSGAAIGVEWRVHCEARIT